MTQNKTFRFLFSENITNLLNTFSNLHKNKHRKVFQTEWNHFVKENQDVMQEEINRIQSSGYKGNVLEKMFTSARYYYRKKTLKESSTPKERKEYKKIPKSILYNMDNHIREQIKKGSSPTSSFDEYFQQIQTLLKSQNQFNIELEDNIEKKLKNSYKNRYQVESKRQKTK